MKPKDIEGILKVSNAMINKKFDELDKKVEKSELFIASTIKDYTSKSEQAIERAEKTKDGKDGINGKDGRNGIDGKNGRDGKDGLNGKDGRNGIDGRNGTDGKNGRDGRDGKDGLKGDTGHSAYELAKKNGYVGSEKEWLESLKAELNLIPNQAVAGYTNPLPPKGTTGQVLAKKSNQDRDYVWVDQSGGGGAVSSVFTRTGDVVAQAGDYTLAQITEDATHRSVTDAEKSTWNAKASTSVATTSVNGLMSSADKTKLDGVATNANNYTHPANHPPSIITQDTSNRFVTDAEKTAWNGKQSALVSGTNIKTINGSSILGSGDLPISGGSSNTPTYTSVSTPTPPATDSLTIFAKNRAGRMMLNTVGPTGLDTALQNALFGNNVYMWLPSNTTTASIAFGTLWTARNTTGAQATPAKAITNILTNMSRATFSSTTAVNTGAGTQSAQTTVCRSNTSAYGGFFFFTRFGMETISGTGQQVFIGLNTLNGTLAGEPSLLNNSIGIAKDSTDTNWFIQSRNASAVTRLDTGVAIVTGVVYDFMMFCKPNDTKVTVRLVNVGTGAVLLDNVEITGTLPVNTTYMYACAHLRNTGTAINALALNRIYVETDI